MIDAPEPYHDDGDGGFLPSPGTEPVMTEITLQVNGAARKLAIDDPELPLLYALRDDLGLRGPKFGCGLGQCGACTVLIDGEATRSCVMPALAADGREVTTLEGLGSPDRPSRVQAAFIAEQAAQCGYCTNGMIMTATALLARMPQPSEADVRDALAQNLCRCGSHVRVLAAVLRAAREG
jgi:nicotinate dehydrogenase subunit A